MLAEGEAAESEALSQSANPRGRVRLAAPMSFGLLHVAPLLPAFLTAYPEISIDLHLSDATVDLIGDGFDAAIRIAALADSSMIARKLGDMALHLVAAPAYLKAHGRPKHPLELAAHPSLTYAYQAGNETWRFHRGEERANVRPAGPLRVNNGEAMLPALTAGLGFAVLPEFLVRDALAAGQLEIVLPEWQLPAGAVHWLTPPGGPKPQRLTVLSAFFARELAAACAPHKRANRASAATAS